MGKDVIIACDFPGAKETIEFLEKFGDRRPYVKIGMELFYAEGPEIVRVLKERGHKVFLDLKLHDIPNTVKGAMKVLARLDVDMCNVHGAGGSRMMKAAIEGLSEGEGSGRPLLIAVTQLTSTSQEQLRDEILIDLTMEEAVASYGRLARDSGLDGVVCSPLESRQVHERLGSDFLTVTPGVRLEGDAAGDQTRVTTPEKAKELGSDYIVVGRSITKAEDPAAAYDRCMREFTE